MIPNAVVCDTEVYPNYFLIAFKLVETGKIVTYEMWEDEFAELGEEHSDFDREAVRKILEKRTTITFNGASFDFPIIAGALAGKPCGALKYMADCIIHNNLKPFITEKQFDIAIPRAWDHIDLIEVAPGKASLKLYNGRLHGRRMQDLPYEPDRRLTRQEMRNVKEYCCNDLDATELLLKACDEPLALRIQMGKKWGIDLRSKSDAQVAESLILERLRRKLGRKIEKPDFESIREFKYQVPEWVSFKDERLQGIVDRLRDYTFVVNWNGKIDLPDFLVDEPIRLGGRDYQMGIGGLHSCEGTQAYYATKDVSIVDRDVKSYYPYLIMTLRLFPKHVGEAFLEIFGDILDTRVKEKDSIKPLKTAGRLAESLTAALNADSLKIAVNGIFGKLGSIFSKLFAPSAMIHTTISGQLGLLMSIEAMVLAGMEVISANTDGFVTLVPKDKEVVFAANIAHWEKITGLVTEETRYWGIFNANVNNYVAFEVDDKDGNPGKAKAKGLYLNCWEKIDKPVYREAMQKNVMAPIVLEAVTKRIRYGTPVWETIRACDEIRKFVMIVTVNGGSLYDGEYLGKAIRWYYGHSSVGCIQIKKTGNKVGRSEGAVPLMTLPDYFPNDVNFEKYEHMAIEALANLGVGAEVTKKFALPATYDKMFKQIERVEKKRRK